MTDRFRLTRTYRFEAAHHLPATAHDHPCHRVHGHSYVVDITVAGEIGETSGWVVDYAEIDAAASLVRSELDHRLLNEITGLENPTSERLALWLWGLLAPALPGLDEIVVRETERSACSYRGPN